jgi:hypothetical protein
MFMDGLEATDKESVVPLSNKQPVPYLGPLVVTLAPDTAVTTFAAGDRSWKFVEFSPPSQDSRRLLRDELGSNGTSTTDTCTGEPASPASKANVSPGSIVLSWARNTVTEARPFTSVDVSPLITPPSMSALVTPVNLHNIVLLETAGLVCIVKVTAVPSLAVVEATLIETCEAPKNSEFGQICPVVGESDAGSELCTATDVVAEKGFRSHPILNLIIPLPLVVSSAG